MARRTSFGTSASSHDLSKANRARAQFALAQLSITAVPGLSILRASVRANETATVLVDLVQIVHLKLLFRRQRMSIVGGPSDLLACDLGDPDLPGDKLLHEGIAHVGLRTRRLSLASVLSLSLCNQACRSATGPRSSIVLWCPYHSRGRSEDGQRIHLRIIDFSSPSGDPVRDPTGSEDRCQPLLSHLPRSVEFRPISFPWFADYHLLLAENTRVQQKHLNNKMRG